MIRSLLISPILYPRRRYGRCVAVVISGVCDSVSVSVCAFSTKLCRRPMHGSRSTCINSEPQGQKVKRRCRSRGYQMRCRRGWVYMSVGLLEFASYLMRLCCFASIIACVLAWCPSVRHKPRRSVQATG